MAWDQSTALDKPAEAVVEALRRACLVMWAAVVATRGAGNICYRAASVHNDCKLPWRSANLESGIEIPAVPPAFIVCLQGGRNSLIDWAGR